MLRRTRSAISDAKFERHAVVIGGSVAGLLAARVLSDAFERVTIVERDRLPDEPELRGGVPQAHHGHALLLRGRQIMERLLPGLEANLLADGTLLLDQAEDANIRFKGGWAPRINSGLKVFSVSRPLLEHHIRARVLALPNVTLLDNRDVLELLTDASGEAITGIHLQTRGNHYTEYLEADLVVDASGRASKMPDWLARIGYPQPQETTVQPHVGYATRWYDVPADFQGDWHAMWIQAVWPNIPRGGLILPIEGHRWQVTLFGVAKDYPPTGEEAFLEYARSLASPRLYEAIKHATPVSPIYGYRNTVNRMRHYEKLARFPERLLVMGDAFFALNPTYAQGMTASALSAEALADCLREQRGRLDGLGRKFQRRAAKALAPAWTLTTTEDLRWDTTEGGARGPMVRFLHWYTDKVMMLIPQDEAIYRAFLPVQHMLKAPTSLFAPAIARKVFAQALRRAPQAQPVTTTQEVRAVGAGD